MWKSAQALTPILARDLLAPCRSVKVRNMPTDIDTARAERFAERAIDLGEKSGT